MWETHKMIRVRVLAVLCVFYVLRVTSKCREATYHDSSFDVNKPGYLYNIGAASYIGLMPNFKNRIGCSGERERALRVRVHLNPSEKLFGFVVKQDTDSPSDVRSRNIKMSELLKKKVLYMCEKNNSNNMRLTEYFGDESSNLVFTPPQFNRPNSFQIMHAQGCIGASPKSGLLEKQVCVVEDMAEHTDELLLQQFAWVPVDTYNKGVDPDTYNPEPDLTCQKQQEEEEKEEKKEEEKELKRIEAEKQRNNENSCFWKKSPTNYPELEPYNPQGTPGSMTKKCSDSD
ncbi:hypothetical protein NEFER03_2028 [Nematocida sp. LUAm3]|nr:hypothetical protein NEFER03_2028 [Nematocida sp. LUAm3]KAI5174502.1 hypothetical protein NEFER02_0623 [Nematocida sp. LUAm2]KAI5179153.1 hypothetical protein NEFER01_2016 [Nematocida sp. LUAm1]